MEKVKSDPRVFPKDILPKDVHLYLSLFSSLINKYLIRQRRRSIDGRVAKMSWPKHYVFGKDVFVTDAFAKDVSVTDIMSLPKTSLTKKSVTLRTPSIFAKEVCATDIMSLPKTSKQRRLYQRHDVLPKTSLGKTLGSDSTTSTGVYIMYVNTVFMLHSSKLMNILVDEMMIL